MEPEPLMAQDTIDVALFPIPNVVAFPGAVLPLHVFEPRYRKLVRDCVRDDRMVAVSHVGKTIREPRKNQTLEEALSSNQATYQPREVFCAGYCEIVETTDDGRIIAEIAMRHRLRLVEEVQSLPYRIVSCTVVEDHEPEAPRAESAELQRLINDRLIHLIGGESSAVARELASAAWAGLAPAEYSFRIFQFLQLDAELLQTILEADSANARLQIVWDLLRGA